MRTGFSASKTTLIFAPLRLTRPYYCFLSGFRFTMPVGLSVPFVHIVHLVFQTRRAMEFAQMRADTARHGFIIYGCVAANS